ncbi:zinc finger protein 37-like isoform X2 [Physella acuta]|nr:zinc finger protein 37-like isoform X2 [Physella acuta]
MEYIHLNKTLQTVEVSNVKGSVLLYLDNKEFLEFSFLRSVKINFVLDDCLKKTNTVHTSSTQSYKENGQFSLTNPTYPSQTIQSFQQKINLTNDGIYLQDSDKQTEPVQVKQESCCTNSFISASSSDDSIQSITPEKIDQQVLILLESSESKFNNKVYFQDNDMDTEPGNIKELCSFSSNTSLDDAVLQYKSQENLTTQENNSLDDTMSLPLDMEIEFVDDEEQSIFAPNQHIPKICDKAVEVISNEQVQNQTENPKALRVSKKLKKKPPARFYCKLCKKKFRRKMDQSIHKRNLACRSKCSCCDLVFPSQGDLFVHQFKSYDFSYLRTQFPQFQLEKPCRFAYNKRLTCPICSQVVMRKGFECHVKLHFDELSYKCCSCGDTLKTNADYLKHCKYHLQGLSIPEIKYKKRYRPTTNKMAENILSKDLTKEDSVQCKYCKKMFGSEESLRAHKDTPSLNLSCQICDAVLPSQASKICHDLEVHKIKLNIPDKDFPVDSNVESKRNKDSGKNRRIPSGQYMSCPVCSLKVSTFALRQHVMQMHTQENPYTCCLCPFSCFNLHILRKHCERHITTPKCNVQCKKCQEVFKNRKDFQKHLKTHMTVCHFCNVDLKFISLLKSHYKSEHSEQMHKCSQCEMWFTSADKLQEHERMHQTRIRQQCPKCGAMVYRVDQHISDIHVEPGLEFPCSICQKKLKNKAGLVQHMRIHEDKSSGKIFVCPKCSKKYSCETYLTYHISTIHTNRKFYDCHTCGKNFSFKHNLKTHMRLHSPLKLFCCEVCGQGFNYKASLQSHLKSKHKVEC